MRSAHQNELSTCRHCCSHRFVSLRFASLKFCVPRHEVCLLTFKKYPLSTTTPTVIIVVFKIATSMIITETSSQAHTRLVLLMGTVTNACSSDE